MHARGYRKSEHTLSLFLPFWSPRLDAVTDSPAPLLPMCVVLRNTTSDIGRLKMRRTRSATRREGRPHSDNQIGFAPLPPSVPRSSVRPKAAAVSDVVASPPPPPPPPHMTPMQTQSCNGMAAIRLRLGTKNLSHNLIISVQVFNSKSQSETNKRAMAL